MSDLSCSCGTSFDPKSAPTLPMRKAALVVLGDWRLWVWLLVGGSTSFLVAWLLDLFPREGRQGGVFGGLIVVMVLLGPRLGRLLSQSRRCPGCGSIVRPG